MSKVTRTLARNWDEWVAAIPDDLAASAKEHGALLRQRSIGSAVDLLRLILVYATGLSLRATALWAVGLEVCDISRQAIDKRVHRSTSWLRYLLSVLLNTLFVVPCSGQGLIRRVVFRDASAIARPGSPGTEWRIHVTWCPFHLQPAQVTLTDAHTGEGLDEAGLEAGDLVVADRAHGIWRTIEVALQALAFFIIRLTWSNLLLCTPDGQPFDLIAWLHTLPADQACAEVSVTAADDPQQRPLRLVVGRLPPDKAAEAQERVRRQARKEKRPLNPNTLLAAEFCILLTNLLATVWPTRLVLAFYRLRWQIEWCFRRWKSLCHLDELPAYPAPIAEPLLLAKLILILLMQHHLDALPWREWWSETQPAPVVSAVVQMTYHHICELIRPHDVILQLLQDPTPFMRHLRSSRRKRPLQLADAARRFAGLLTDLAT